MASSGHLHKGEDFFDLTLIWVKIANRVECQGCGGGGGGAARSAGLANSRATAPILIQVKAESSCWDLVGPEGANIHVEGRIARCPALVGSVNRI